MTEAHPTPLVGGSWPGEEEIARVMLFDTGLFDTPAEIAANADHVLVTTARKTARAVLKLFENTRSQIHDGAFALNGQCDHPVSEDGNSEADFIRGWETARDRAAVMVASCHGFSVTSSTPGPNATPESLATEACRWLVSDLSRAISEMKLNETTFDDGRNVKD